MDMPSNLCWGTASLGAGESGGPQGRTGGAAAGVCAGGGPGGGPVAEDCPCESSRGQWLSGRKGAAMRNTEVRREEGCACRLGRPKRSNDEHEVQ